MHNIPSMIPPMIRSAPAKINLCLRVLGRRADGYHDIDSLLVPLELADRIEVLAQRGARSEVSCTCPEHPSLDGGDNIAARAARRFLDETGHRACVSITVNKQIWIAAGLGGGSSDAAAVLVALQELLGGLHAEAMHDMACRLGADVPFFLDPRPQRATGIGTTLNPVYGLPAMDVVLVNPGSQLDTGRIYAQCQPEAWEPADVPGIPDLLPATSEGIAELLHNDLEVLAESMEPRVRDQKQALIQAGALGASMSGSGPTVFGIFKCGEEARAAAHNISNSTGFWARATRTVAA